MDESHDHGPHSSDDPRYTETWFWNAIDPVSGRAIWVHVSWLPAQKRGQHVLAVVSPKGVYRERVDTSEPLRSSLLNVEIVSPWEEMRLRSPGQGVDLSWRAFTEAVDFGELIHMGGDMTLKHYEGAGRARGTVQGDSFTGSGFRDRSFGPRNLRRFGRHWAVTMIGQERDVMVNVTSMWAGDLPHNAPPGLLFAFKWEEGKSTIARTGIVPKRRRDASLGEVQLADGTVIEVDVAKAFGQTRFILDPNSAPKDDLTTEPAYSLLNTFLPASSPTLGPLVGWLEDGVVWNT